MPPPGARIAEGGHLQDASGRREEDALAGVGAYEARIKCDAALSINGGDDGLRCDVEALEGAAARRRLARDDDELHRFRLRRRERLGCLGRVWRQVRPTTPPTTKPREPAQRSAAANVHLPARDQGEFGSSRVFAPEFCSMPAFSASMS